MYKTGKIFSRGGCIHRRFKNVLFKNVLKMFIEKFEGKIIEAVGVLCKK